MEGILWKWTNYWSGWQPRWFVLDNGVLAYYKSQEEVNQGCKGSIKMSVCEIIVNSVDSTRLDLVIPSEQHFYLKAATPQERQQWLVALGSAKASLSSRQKKDTSGGNPDLLKTKKSELRLYCDLLMQQVHTVKSSAMEKSPPDIDTLNEATSLLGATCDTFIKTLEECMKLANANFPYELPHQFIPDSALPPSLVPSNAFRKGKGQVNRSCSVDNSNDYPYCSSRKPSWPYEDSDDELSEPLVTRVVSDQEIEARTSHSAHEQPTSSTECLKSALAVANGHCEDEDDEEETWADISDNENNNETCLDTKEKQEEEEVETNDAPKMVTFFSNLKVSFLNLKVCDSDNGIPTTHFLESCAIVITIFGMFGSPIFAPMKLDVMGNLNKINNKYKMNPEKFDILQNIVKYEMSNNTTTSRNSATDALMWLKRGLEFVYEFLLEFARGNPDLKNCALNAYNRSLKQYHGWIVRGVISTATRTVPSREEVLAKLALHPDDVNNPLYEEELKEDARRFIRAMDKIIKILNDFYALHNLDKKYVV